MESGIYCIENKIDGKKYIGKDSRINMQKRWKEHVLEFKKGIHYNNYFQRAWNKYGEENFIYYIVEYCSWNILNEKETFYINKFKTKAPNGYNLTDGGEGMFGYIPSQKTRNKISKANSGENNGMYGKTHTEKTKELIRLKNKGKFSGKDNPMYGIPSPMTGKKHKEESKIKVRIAKLGIPRDEETKKKLRKKKRNSSSCFNGIFLDKYKKRIVWKARIWQNGKLKNIGLSKDEIYSAIIYDKYIIKNNLPNPINFPKLLHFINIKFLFYLYGYLRKIIYRFL